MIKIDLTSAEKRKPILGFGTSACWWSQNVADKSTANELAALLYGKSGLGLNIYRYNIGAGWDDGNCRVENPWRRCESFTLMIMRMKAKALVGIMILKRTKMHTRF